jgi:hypothetical protein
MTMAAHVFGRNIALPVEVYAPRRAERKTSFGRGYERGAGGKLGRVIFFVSGSRRPCLSDDSP